MASDLKRNKTGLLGMLARSLAVLAEDATTGANFQGGNTPSQSVESLYNGHVGAGGNTGLSLEERLEEGLRER